MGIVVAERQLLGWELLLMEDMDFPRGGAAWARLPSNVLLWISNWTQTFTRAKG